jgi:hypothetical protein
LAAALKGKAARGSLLRLRLYGAPKAAQDNVDISLEIKARAGPVLQ